MSAIITLRERPDLIALVAAWSYAQWPKAFAGGMAETTALAASCTAEIGPDQCFVLLDAAVPAAMISLVAEDLPERRDLSPWLAGLYVDGPFRGRGHARRLVRHVEHAAMQAAISTLWLYTSSAAGLYRRLGWRDETPLGLGTGPAMLMRRDLGGSR